RTSPIRADRDRFRLELVAVLLRPETARHLDLSATRQHGGSFPHRDASRTVPSSSASPCPHVRQTLQCTYHVRILVPRQLSRLTCSGLAKGDEWTFGALQRVRAPGWSGA